MSAAESRLPRLRRVGPDPADAEAVVIGVHGRDQDAAWFVHAVVEPVDDSDVCWILPEAAGGSWYPHGFRDEVDANEPHVTAAMDSLHVLVAGIAVPDERIVWAGFSQGACLAIEFVARNPRRWGGLVAFTGGRMGPPGTSSPISGDLGGMPAYLGAGVTDPWIEPNSVRDAGADLERAGAEVMVELFDDADHAVRPEEIARLREMLVTVRRIAVTSVVDEEQR